MRLTRRRFIECAAGAAGSALAMALPRELAALDAVEPRPRGPEADVASAVLDLGEHCSLPESRAGYESALAQLGVRTVHIDARSVPDCAMLIVPAAVRISPAIGALIRSRLHNGATVILESGAGFTDADGADFRAHRDALREELRLHVEWPMSLWARPSGAAGIPYVEYSWPAEARVRDFSRVVPVSRSEPGDAIIARVDGVPAALMRRSGSGTLIFLGSPLGPALRSGDAEASQWLADVHRTTAALSATSARAS